MEQVTQKWSYSLILTLISFGKVFERIRTSSKSQFRGVFDVQGDVISNLNMNSSSSQYAGLFGYSEGLVIKNVILDSSCSITSAFNASGRVFAGGIICYCKKWNNWPCNIENNVNMGNVTFSGDIIDSYFVYLGGIVGYLYSDYSPEYNSTIKICVNYGFLSHTLEQERYHSLGNCWLFW